MAINPAVLVSSGAQPSAAVSAKVRPVPVSRPTPSHHQNHTAKACTAALVTAVLLKRDGKLSALRGPSSCSVMPSALDMLLCSFYQYDNNFGSV